MDGVVEPITISVVPFEPGVPVVVTPVVYSVPPVVLGPSGVSDNLNGCPVFEASY